jgi:hypothetical protein
MQNGVYPAACFNDVSTRLGVSRSRKCRSKLLVDIHQLRTHQRTRLIRRGAARKANAGGESAMTAPVPGLLAFIKDLVR